MRKFSDEQVGQILIDYSDTSQSVTSIAQKYGTSTSHISHIVKAHGGELRVPKHSFGKVIKCGKCYRKIEVKGAKFCPYCGADIRSEKDLILEKTNKLFSILGLLPESQRDPAQKIIRDICAYINKEEK